MTNAGRELQPVPDGRANVLMYARKRPRPSAAETARALALVRAHGPELAQAFGPYVDAATLGALVCTCTAFRHWARYNSRALSLQLLYALQRDEARLAARGRARGAFAAGFSAHGLVDGAPAVVANQILRVLPEMQSQYLCHTPRLHDPHALTMCVESGIPWGTGFDAKRSGIHVSLVFDDEARTPVPLLGPSSGADLEWRYQGDAHVGGSPFADEDRRALPVLLITVRRLSSHFGQRKFRLCIAARVVRADQAGATPAAVYCAHSPAFVSVSRIQTPASIATQRRRRATQRLGARAF
jgi:hypothetical protein